MESVWQKGQLYDEAVTLAKQLDEGLDIEHFWKVADRRLSGTAPTTESELAVRAEAYIAFDEAVVLNACDMSDPNVDASKQRFTIWTANQQNIKSDKDLIKFVCKTNLLFLGREMFDRDYTFFTHARVCNLFVQKDSSKKIYEQDPTKNRLLMFPRGGFKSDIDCVDCVQWILNFPDIRILILTAEKELATSFIGDVKKYFLVPIGAKPTVFHDLFKEFSPRRSREEGAEKKFICPCREAGFDESKEPTIWASSILSNLPGWHCDVVKMDDVVNDKNTEKAELIAKVQRKVVKACKLVDPGGYYDFIGTPYSPKDLYSWLPTSFAHPEFELKKLVQPAWERIPESLAKDEKDCVESDYKLLFEFDKTGQPRLTYDFLCKARRADPDDFKSQYLLDPSGTKKVSFPLELLHQQTISREQLPMQLSYYIIWDFAYGTNKRNDYSVGAVIGLDVESRAYLVYMFRDKYIDNDLAMEIARSNKEFSPRLIPIENSNGAQFLESSIRRYADELGSGYIPLDFFKVDNSENAKASRVGALQPILVQRRLFFVNDLACLEDLYKEFKEFGDSLHDDIPDTLSHLFKILPAQSAEPEGGRERAKQLVESIRLKDFEEMIWPDRTEEAIIPEPEVDPEPETTEYVDLGFSPFKPQ